MTSSEPLVLLPLASGAALGAAAGGQERETGGVGLASRGCSALPLRLGETAIWVDLVEEALEEGRPPRCPQARCRDRDCVPEFACAARGLGFRDVRHRSYVLLVNPSIEPISLLISARALLRKPQRIEEVT